MEKYQRHQGCTKISLNQTLVDQLLKLFSSKGLTPEDLVVLSGAHTIGFAHCKQFVSRLYDYKGTKKPDPYMDPRLFKVLKMSCPQFGGNVDIVAPFDVTTPFSFDNAYYGNLEAKLGLLASDQALSLDPRTKSLWFKIWQRINLSFSRLLLLLWRKWEAVLYCDPNVVSVEVEGRIVSAIGPGFTNQTLTLHVSELCLKVLNMRLFPNEETGKTWDLSVVQKNYEVLLVSQFTLHGILKGNKPDFHVAMPPEKVKPFYASLVEKFQKAYKQDAVKDGVFGAMMKVDLVNDGPVTMHLDSAQLSK
ncbi:hypothetical protein K7X08_018050 [Anisodus acutangulus]|uniref:Peroxidase n=1 Tax=Anisodus acutangulus TaxID=402998 RepID=A0A9Q1LYH1_9SOLA|nr:hypothetical protein K7X08_018050 [Anisodus acutangulus]